MNNGHNLIFGISNNSHPQIIVSGGPLSYKYQFQELHIHFGMHEKYGSEHTINGTAFPTEVFIARIL